MLIKPDRKYLEEAFIGYKVSVSYIKTFSYIAYINIPKEV